MFCGTGVQAQSLHLRFQQVSLYSSINNALGGVHTKKFRSKFPSDRTIRLVIQLRFVVFLVGLVFR